MLWQGRSCLEAKPSNITSLQQTLSRARNNRSQNNNWRTRPGLGGGKERLEDNSSHSALAMCVLLYYGELSVASANICHQSCAGGEGRGEGGSQYIRTALTQIKFPSLLQLDTCLIISQKIKLQCTRQNFRNWTFVDDGSNSSTHYLDHHSVLLQSGSP